MSEHETADGLPLWSGDDGGLRELTRRALLEILKGPFLSGREKPQLWSALRADEGLIRSRLNDLFLDLVIDDVDEIAFARKVRTSEIEVPSALRTVRMTFLDTAMLLVLRQILLSAAGERRVIVGKEEVYERLAVYRDGDEATFRRNLNGAWSHMVKDFRVLHKAGEDRVEISPMVKFMIDDEQVRSLTEIYQTIAAGGSE